MATTVIPHTHTQCHLPNIPKSNTTIIEHTLEATAVHICILCMCMCVTMCVCVCGKLKDTWGLNTRLAAHYWACVTVKRQQQNRTGQDRCVCSVCACSVWLCVCHVRTYIHMLCVWMNECWCVTCSRVHSYINSRSTHSTVTEFIYHYTHTLTHTTWLVLQTVYARKCMCICECVCIACLCVVPCLLCTWVDKCVLRRMTWFSFSHKHLD